MNIPPLPPPMPAEPFEPVIDGWEIFIIVAGTGLIAAAFVSIVFLPMVGICR